MAYKNPSPKINDELFVKSSEVILNQCDFCGKNDVLVVGNAKGAYCKDCLNLIIVECKESLKKIEEYETSKSYKRVSKSHKTTKKELVELEKAKDEALAKLMQGNFATGFH